VDRGGSVEEQGLVTDIKGLALDIKVAAAKGPKGDDEGFAEVVSIDVGFAQEILVDRVGRAGKGQAVAELLQQLEQLGILAGSPTARVACRPWPDRAVRPVGIMDGLSSPPFRVPYWFTDRPRDLLVH